MLALLLLSHAAGAATALVADRLIDARSDSARTPGVVVVEGDRIVAVGDRSIIPPRAEIVELGDATLMPGMINAHEHPLMYADDYQQTHLANSSAYKTLMALAGTKAQVFTITSGTEVYWLSTDCQVDPVDAEVSLTPGTPISSSVPIVWDRTRSSVDTCQGPREAVPAGGASYHLAVTVDGFASESTKQFQLY